MRVGGRVTADEATVEELEKVKSNLEEELSLKNGELEVARHAAETLENKNFSLESDNSRVTRG